MMTTAIARVNATRDEKIEESKQSVNVILFQV